MVYGPTMDNADEKRRYKKLQLQSRQRKLRLDDAVKALMQHQQGRDYLYWLLELCGIGRNPFTANALTTSFSCGELNVGQQIQAHIIEVAPEGYLQMLREREEERLKNERDSGNSDDSDGNDASDSAE